MTTYPKTESGRLLAEHFWERFGSEIIANVNNYLRFQHALDRAWFALYPRKPTWWKRLLRVLVWP